MYKAMIPFLEINDKTLIHNASHLFDRNRSGKKPVDIQQLIHVVKYCYLNSFTQEPANVLFVKMAVIILTTTDVTLKNIQYVTNRVWKQFNSTLRITFPNQRMTITADQFMYELAKQIILVNDEYPPNESIVPLNTTTLNRTFKQLYLQLNLGAKNVGSLGLNQLRRINKHALYELLRLEGGKILREIYPPGSEPEITEYTDPLLLAAKSFNEQHPPNQRSLPPIPEENEPEQSSGYGPYSGFSFRTPPQSDPRVE